MSEDLENVLNEVKGLTAMINSLHIAECEGGAHVYSKEAFLCLELICNRIVKQLRDIQAESKAKQ